MQQLAAVRVQRQELLVTEEAVGELARAEGAVADGGGPGKRGVERAELALEANVCLGGAEQPAVDPQARVEVDDLPADVFELGSLLAHGVKPRKAAGGTSCGRLGSLRAGYGLWPAFRPRLRSRVLLVLAARVLGRAECRRAAGKKNIALAALLPLEHVKVEQVLERGLARPVLGENAHYVLPAQWVLAQADETARDAARDAALLDGQLFAEELCQGDDRVMLLLGEFLCHRCLSSGVAQYSIPLRAAWACGRQLARS